MCVAFALECGITFKWYGNSWNETFDSQRVWIGFSIELADWVYRKLILITLSFLSDLRISEQRFFCKSVQISKRYFLFFLFLFVIIFLLFLKIHIKRPNYCNRHNPYINWLNTTNAQIYYAKKVITNNIIQELTPP